MAHWRALQGALQYAKLTSVVRKFAAVTLAGAARSTSKVKITSTMRHMRVLTIIFRDHRGDGCAVSELSLFEPLRAWLHLGARRRLQLALIRCPLIPGNTAVSLDEQFRSYCLFAYKSRVVFGDPLSPKMRTAENFPAQFSRCKLIGFQKPDRLVSNCFCVL
jgi:hypothetical protein